MTMKDALYTYLESPGTKAYTLDEARVLLSRVGFDEIKVSSKLSFGDLLMVEPSAKYRSPLFKLAWRIYPRWLVRLLGDRYGLGLLIEAVKTIPSQ